MSTPAEGNEEQRQHEKTETLESELVQYIND